MPKNIIQKIVFKNTTPKAVYETYMDAKKHAIIAGGPAKITRKEGAKYSVFEGYATGKNLQLIPNSLIVQTWRASDWNKDDEDSVFIIQLEAKGKDTIVNMFHLNVPDKQAEALDGGWHTFYWKPMKDFLAGKPVKHAEM